MSGRAARVERQVDGDCYRHASDSGQQRQRESSPLPQLAEVELAPRLEPEHKEEEGHQPAVHPLAKLERHSRPAHLDRKRRRPQRVVRRRVDVHPHKSDDRRSQEDRSAPRLRAQEFAQRRLEVSRPRSSPRERRRLSFSGHDPVRRLVVGREISASLALVRGREILLGPTADLFERREQGTACVGQLVRDGDGRPIIDAAGGEPNVAERAQSIGEHRVADPFDSAGEGTEPYWSTAQRRQHHSGPALPEKVERTRERRVAADASLSVKRRLRLARGLHEVNASTGRRRFGYSSR